MVESLPEFSKSMTLQEYQLWLKVEHKKFINDELYKNYDISTRFAKQQFENSKTWHDLINLLNNAEFEYSKEKHYDLISRNAEYFSNNKPIIFIKPFDSVVNKTYRKNVLENENWNQSPTDGWVFPEDWFNKINDILRTLIVVKYADGVVYLVNKLKEYCLCNKIHIDTYYQAKDEGYYAAHCYIIFPINFPCSPWDNNIKSCIIEIQITTQIQEVIRKLLHIYYESQRISPQNVDWQWNFKTDEFSVNYLGHILHYVEGLIVDIRDNKEGESKNDCTK